MRRSLLLRSHIRRRPVGAGAGYPVSGSLLHSKPFYADQVGIPTATHPVTAIAPSDLDNLYNDLVICEFDDTIEQGRTFKDRVPDAANFVLDAGTVDFEIVGKPNAAPAGNRNVRWELNYRNIDNNGALGAWAALTLGDMVIPANTNFQYSVFSLVIGAGAGELDVTPGNHVEFELVRIAPAADNLTGDLHFYAITPFWFAV